MEAVSRGAKEAGGKTYGVTAEFFKPKANAWIDVEVRMKTWQERLFELIRLGDGFVACKGGTGTLVELAVVWDGEQSGDGRETVFGPRQLLGAGARSRPGSRVGASRAVGRSERTN